MTTPRAFLKAGWRKLLLLNYAVDPALLEPYLPPHTRLDVWNNTCYVSLVGFMFIDTRVMGLKIPGHTTFEEVNLRFYVTHQLPGGEVRRGVCFIKEIVPKAAITMVANTLYKEKYHTMPMKHYIQEMEEELRVSYQWHYQKHWHTIACEAKKTPQAILPGSEEEFITEHYWGYTRINNTSTSEYGVEHPRWQVYDVNRYAVDVNFETLYGASFATFSQQKPVSVFLAEGSEIVVRKGHRIQ